MFNVSEYILDCLTSKNPISRNELESKLPSEYRGMCFQTTLTDLFYRRLIKFVSKPTDEPIQLGAETVTVDLNWVELNNEETSP